MICLRNSSHSFRYSTYMYMLTGAFSHFNIHVSFNCAVISVSERDLQSDSPFTRALTESLCIQKEEQTKRKTNPPGTSKILTKALKKAKQEEKVKVRKPFHFCVFVFFFLFLEENMKIT